MSKSTLFEIVLFNLNLGKNDLKPKKIVYYNIMTLVKHCTVRTFISDYYKILHGVALFHDCIDDFPDKKEYINYRN